MSTDKDGWPLELPVLEFTTCGPLCCCIACAVRCAVRDAHRVERESKMARTLFEAVAETTEKPSAGKAVIPSFMFDTMEPDEFSGAIGDMRCMLDDLEKGQESGGDPLTPARAKWIAQALAETAISFAHFATTREGKIPSVK